MSLRGPGPAADVAAPSRAELCRGAEGPEAPRLMAGGADSARAGLLAGKKEEDLPPGFCPQIPQE